MQSILRRRGLRAGNGSGGFTLVELAVGLAIISLLLGALLTPLATQHRMRKNKEAERELREVKVALIGFAIANGRLPWPDTEVATPDGLENVPAGVTALPPTPVGGPPCTVCEGLLPWQTLGTVPTDPWGRRYRYRISPEFGYPVRTGQPAATAQFDLLEAGTVRVNTRGDVGGGGEKKDPLVLTTDAAAAVVSLGSNGLGGVWLDATSMPDTAAGTDERTNSDDANPAAPTPHFYARRITLPTTGACDDVDENQAFCEFDDLVIWIPRVVLINRMVESGRLP
jgi:prepilin-type N-terminal cleavage/methylation domain-containing protein